MTTKQSTSALTLSALGVVFGDIGTSPLYAFRETLGSLSPSPVDVLGALSLIFWTLIIVISIKYLALVFRADNHGEGGGLALLALLKQKASRYESLLMLIAIFAAGLLLGDGMLTPAISVTSAVEGLKVFSPALEPIVVPLACLVIVVLFLCQSYGTSKIGFIFGPLILVWFMTIGILGLVQIIQNPVVLKAVNPYYAYAFFQVNGAKAYFLLGGAFLAVTGGEALYADIGHFGKQPIRYSWFFLALPCLLLNYFGQGAHELAFAGRELNPFFSMAPNWFYLPLVILSMFATAIASQAVISATFSLTRQAILLGVCPRLPMVQTSSERAGEIYIPQINAILFVGTLLLTLHFQSSAKMTHAYGIAVNLDMLIVTVMVACAARLIWGWSLLRVWGVFSFFFMVDMAFMGANASKFMSGGWMPVCFAIFIAFLMFTWTRGLAYLQSHYHMNRDELSDIVRQLGAKMLKRLPGMTAVFITDVYDRSGGSFLHFLKLFLTVPENILIVNYVVEHTPYVRGYERYEIHKLDEQVFQLTLYYGFMDKIAIPEDLERLNGLALLPFKLPVSSLTYLVEVPHMLVSSKIKNLLFYWQKKLFVFLMRNSTVNVNIDFYKLPHNRTIAIGTYCVI